MLTDCSSDSTRDIHDGAPEDIVEVMGCDWRMEWLGPRLAGWLAGWVAGWLARALLLFRLRVHNVHKVLIFLEPLPLACILLRYAV